MTLVRARLYKGGYAVADYASLADIPAVDALTSDDLLWIGLSDPTPGELTTIGPALKLHPLALEDAFKAHQLPKVDVYENHLFVVAYTADYVNTRILYGETAIFVGANFIVTSRHDSLRDHSAVRAQLEAAPQMLAMGSDYVLHAILDHIVDGYVPALEPIEDQVARTEEKALEAFLTTDEVAFLYRLRRRVTRLQRRIDMMQSMAQRLASTIMPYIDDGARPYFQDISDHLRLAGHRAQELRDQLAGVVETAGLLETQRQGATTRQLAAWAAILAVPTAIAGIYGMNFEFMPELKQWWGYPAVLAVMTTICFALYWRFRKLGWL